MHENYKISREICITPVENRNAAWHYALGGNKLNDNQRKICSAVHLTPLTIQFSEIFLFAKFDVLAIQKLYAYSLSKHTYKTKLRHNFIQSEQNCQNVLVQYINSLEEEERKQSNFQKQKMGQKEKI